VASVHFSECDVVDGEIGDWCVPMTVIRRIFKCKKFNILRLVKMDDIEGEKFASEVKSLDGAIKAERTSDVSG